MSATDNAADVPAQPHYGDNDIGGHGNDIEAGHDSGAAGPSRHSNGITIADNLPHPNSPPAAKRQGGATTTSKTKRSRWATRKMTVKSSNKKRLSLIGRHGKTLVNEQKRASSGSESLRIGGEGNGDANAAAAQEEEHEGPGPRALYFNLPLPDDQKDETGAPKQSYSRNKIRTAKYTPLSFIPKNLYFQFQNIANIFFLFQVILAVCALLALFSPTLPRPFHCFSVFRSSRPSGLSVLFSLLTIFIVLLSLWCREPRSERCSAYRHHRHHRHP